MTHEQPCCGVSTAIEDYFLTRRKFLNRVGMGLGALGLMTMIDPSDLPVRRRNRAGANPLAPKAPPLPATAKAVIHIFAQGAPSHIDTWDPKPELVQMDGRTIGDSGVAMGSPFKFTPMGQSGTEVSELFPQIGQHVDDLAVVRSMYTDIPAHEVATVFMNTGSLRIAEAEHGLLGRLRPRDPEPESSRASSRCATAACPRAAPSTTASAFLPGVYQGSSINTQAANVQQMIQNIHNPYVGGGRAAPADGFREADGRDADPEPRARRRSWRPAWSPTRSPSRCRPRRPTPST